MEFTSRRTKSSCFSRFKAIFAQFPHQNPRKPQFDSDLIFKMSHEVWLPDACFYKLSRNRKRLRCNLDDCVQKRERPSLAENLRHVTPSILARSTESKLGKAPQPSSQPHPSCPLHSFRLHLPLWKRQSYTSSFQGAITMFRTALRTSGRAAGALSASSRISAVCTTLRRRDEASMASKTSFIGLNGIKI